MTNAGTTQPVASLTAHVAAYWRRVRGGDMGALPAVLGILVLVVGFSLARPVFFSATNFANLLFQGAAVTVIAMGLIFVLLLGEIDLSAGYTSGVCASLAAILMLEQHMPWYFAIAIALLTGVVTGLVLGMLVSKVGIPSFVVTLAAFLSFQGVLLLIVKQGQIISIQDSTILKIGNNNLPIWAGWVFYGVSIAGYAGVQLYRTLRRSAKGLTRDPMSLVALRIGALAVAGGVAVYILNLERSFNPARTSLRGVPIVVPIVVILLVALTFVLSRTTYGLHLYAVGGNVEAARRAGIATDRLRISAFVICSTLAAIGGIIAASRDNSVSPTSGGSNVLLYAVGAAVIGGTSLFGGKGRVLDAVLGGAVVAIIDNGMNLLTESSWIKYVVTGLVLLAAAGVDALSRRRAAARGLS
ncbi:sugar ABC transporter permease [Luedemannella helvata]|uniref:Xylose transport system permease protein XylH n=1 Tax=Luedemannella helvata TaxID=349315 RepID=A0ABP4W7U6_9ACTN